MKCICSICRKKITVNRSAHLKNEHGIDSSFKGAVKRYFLTAEEAGLNEKFLKEIPEGERVPHPYPKHLL